MDVSLRMFLCGQLALQGGPALIREADFPGRQGRRLWAYLLLNRRRAVSRDELAEAIWGDDIPDAWDSVLNAVVSRLRSTLRPVTSVASLCIESKPGYYLLRSPVEAFVDYERARSAIHASDAAMRQGDVLYALTEARVAMEIVARGFLHGEDGPWVQRERRLLEEIHIRAIERTIEGEIERNNLDLAEQEGRMLVRLYPLREPGYRLLMRVLAARGNVAEAARVLDDCRDILREQVGIALSRETERLFHEIAKT